MSIRVRLALAFATVAVISVLATGLVANRAIRDQFGLYLSGTAAQPGADGAGGSRWGPMMMRRAPSAARQEAPLPGTNPSPNANLNPARTVNPAGVVNRQGTINPPAAVPRQGGMVRWMAAMMGWVEAERLQPVRDLMGQAEHAFIGSITRSLWIAGLVAAVLGGATGVALSHPIAARLRQLRGRAHRIAEERGLKLQGGSRGGDELDELDEAFSGMEGALEASEAQRRRMLADIAHELRTPLAVIQGHLEGMLDGVIPTTPERLAALHTQAGLLARLVSDLRDLSLAQAGRLALNRTRVDLAAVLGELTELLQPRAQEKGVVLQQQIPQGLSPVDADRDRLAQVLLNLLDNALRHAPEGSRVQVAARQEGETVEVSVSDQGPGVPPEHLPHVFEQFYRVDPARARSTGGTGLGLAIVRSLVEAHGGRAWAESPGEGQGATFRFTVPAWNKRPAPVGQELAAPA